MPKIIKEEIGITDIKEEPISLNSVVIYYDEKEGAMYQAKVKSIYEDEGISYIDIELEPSGEMIKKVDASKSVMNQPSDLDLSVFTDVESLEDPEPESEEEGTTTDEEEAEESFELPEEETDGNPDETVEEAITQAFDELIKESDYKTKQKIYHNFDKIYDNIKSSLKEDHGPEWEEGVWEYIVSEDEKGDYCIYKRNEEGEKGTKVKGGFKSEHEAKKYIMDMKQTKDGHTGEGSGTKMMEKKIEKYTEAILKALETLKEHTINDILQDAKKGRDNIIFQNSRGQYEARAEGYDLGIHPTWERAEQAVRNFYQNAKNMIDEIVGEINPEYSKMQHIKNLRMTEATAEILEFFYKSDDDRIYVIKGNEGEIVLEDFIKDDKNKKMVAAIMKKLGNEIDDFRSYIKEEFGKNKEPLDFRISTPDDGEFKVVAVNKEGLLQNKASLVGDEKQYIIDFARDLKVNPKVGGYKTDFENWKNSVGKDKLQSMDPEEAVDSWFNYVRSKSNK